MKSTHGRNRIYLPKAGLRQQELKKYPRQELNLPSEGRPATVRVAKYPSQELNLPAEGRPAAARIEKVPTAGIEFTFRGQACDSKS
ncbi:MAG: hypothetical protein K9G63_15810 [Melioribacteraceae bacterium]|nr:hypothetical protein [Melioribacteraceae bacterium]